MQFNLSNNIIIGQGETSIATAYYLLSKGHPFLIYSLKPNKLPKALSSYYTNTLGDYSMAWLSPGISIKEPCMQGVSMDKAWLDIDYFLYQYTKPVIAVTGTNGKSSVTNMIKEMLIQLGYKAKCYGNYQPGLLNALSEDLDWIVLELSSFQLERMRFKGKISAVLLLNITSDHINWHGSYEAYREAKLRILALSDITIGVGGQYQFMEGAANLVTQGYDTQTALNLAAAREALYRLGFTPPVLKILPELLYRQNVKYKHNQIVVNDSKSTNLASTISAVTVFQERYPTQSILLIMAGIEKDEQFRDLLNTISSQVTMIVIGQGFQALSAHFSNRYRCIEDAMSCIMNHEGIVLFSPGGASYDQYGNYEERGKDFDRCLFALRAY